MSSTVSAAAGSASSSSSSSHTRPYGAAAAEDAVDAVDAVAAAMSKLLTPPTNDDDDDDDDDDETVATLIELYMTLTSVFQERWDHLYGPQQQQIFRASRSILANNEEEDEEEFYDAQEYEQGDERTISMNDDHDNHDDHHRANNNDTAVVATAGLANENDAGPQTPPPASPPIDDNNADDDDDLPPPPPPNDDAPTPSRPSDAVVDNLDDDDDETSPPNADVAILDDDDELLPPPPEDPATAAVILAEETHASRRSLEEEEANHLLCGKEVALFAKHRIQAEALRAEHRIQEEALRAEYYRQREALRAEHRRQAEERRVLRAVLREEGFDPNNLSKANNRRVDPINYYSHRGNVTMVRYLLVRGADCRNENVVGWFPMLLAAYYGHVEIIKLLSQIGGAHEDIRRGAGRFQIRPLRAALKNDHVDVWKWLIPNGALAPRDDVAGGGIDDMVMRRDLRQGPFDNWQDDRRETVLLWAQTSVANHDHAVQLLFTGMIASSKRPASPLEIFNGYSGILKVIADYGVTGSPQQLRTLRQLTELLPAFIDDTPFVEVEDDEDEDEDEGDY